MKLEITDYVMDTTTHQNPDGLQQGGSVIFDVFSSLEHHLSGFIESHRA